MLFLRRKKETKHGEEKQIAMKDQEEKLQEAVISLDEKKKYRTLDKVSREVDSKVHEAARISIREMKLLEEGRCPECGSQLEQFLYTSICDHCGWSKRLTPQTGKVLVHLKDSTIIECEKIFRVNKGAEYLCIRGEVVVAHLMKEALAYTEDIWTPEELEQVRQQHEQEKIQLCGWCEKKILPEATEKRMVYLAIGVYQYRFFFCSKKCYEAFRKQHPVRVHRDCYERDCANCDECIKRYDSSGRQL